MQILAFIANLIREHFFAAVNSSSRTENAMFVNCMVRIKTKSITELIIIYKQNNMIHNSLQLNDDSKMNYT